MPSNSENAASSSRPVGQHNSEIMRNRIAWREKPLLRRAYHQFYGLIAGRINPEVAGKVVELGSGMGNIKEIIPECITTDLFSNPWLDRQENVYSLSFSNGSISHLVLVDVWHHLRYPGTALAEFHRVLAPAGRVIMCEPAISWLGRLVYGKMHHESIGLREPITWDAPKDFSVANTDYFACQGHASRMFWWHEADGRISQWKLTVTPIVAFSYLAVGGFSGPQLYGRRLAKLVRTLDLVAAKFPRLFAARLIVTLEKRA